MHCLCLMAICNSALQETLAQQQWWQHGFVNRSMLPPHAEEQLTKGSLQLSPPRSHLLIHNPWTQIHAISPCHLRNSNKTMFSKDRNIFNSYLNTFFRLTLKVYPHFTYTTHDRAWPIHKAADRSTFWPIFNIFWADCLRSYTFTHEFLAYKVSTNQKGKNEINIFLHDLLQVTDRS